MIAPIKMASLVRQIPQLVGNPKDPRWKRAKDDLRGSDGESRESFFARTAEKRIELLRERMARHADWSLLLECDIPKASGGVRSVAWGTVLDTGFQYLLAPPIFSYAETVLGAVAIGYRPGLALDMSIRRAVREMRSRGLRHVCVLDIQGFFPSIPWRHLDAVIDSLPADGDIAELLRKLVRARVRRVDGTYPERTSGIPAGLPVAPVLANLVLATLDRRSLGALARRRVLVVRFADDFLLAAADAPSLLWAIHFVTEQLRRLGLKVKTGTGVPVDVFAPGASVRWLGVELVGRPSGGDFILRAPKDAVLAKGHEIRARLDRGIISDLEAERRLRGLERFYRALLPDRTTDDALKELRSQVFPDSWSRVLSPPRSRAPEEERKVSTQTYDDLLHPLSIPMAIPKPPRGPKLDGDRGEDRPCRSLFGPVALAVRGSQGSEGTRAGTAGAGSRPYASSSGPSVSEGLGKWPGRISSRFELVPPSRADRAISAEGAGTPAGRRSGDPFESALRPGCEPNGPGDPPCRDRFPAERGEP